MYIYKYRDTCIPSDTNVTHFTLYKVTCVDINVFYYFYFYSYFCCFCSSNSFMSLVDGGPL